MLLVQGIRGVRGLTHDNSDQPRMNTDKHGFRNRRPAYKVGYFCSLKAAPLLP